MTSNSQVEDDSKPSARDITAGNADAAEPQHSEQKEDASDSRWERRNTKEFSHALNHLPTEKIPSYTREFDSILTFPEKFMLMLAFIERTSSSAGRKMEDEAIHWIRNGTVVVVRNPNELNAKWIWRFFGTLKYESFIRKAYRWAFRKSSSLAFDLPLDCHVFSNPNFCRDRTDLLCEMKSTTAAKIRAASKTTEATRRPAQIMESSQSPMPAAGASRIAETAWSVVPTLGNPLVSYSDPLQHRPAPLVSNHEPLLAQQLRTLQLQSLLTSSVLSQPRNNAICSAGTLDLLLLRLRLNQPVQPQVPSAPELLQLIRLQNENTSMPNTSALEEILRRMRQNPPR